MGGLTSLWNRVMTEYHIEDVGGRELLALKRFPVILQHIRHA
jgi:hypothetical protein